VKNKNENTVSNIWSTQENLIHFYKMMSLGLAGLAIVILIFTMLAYTKDPIVVIQGGHGQGFYPANRQSIKVEKSDVDTFVRDYLESLYVWGSFDSEKLAGEIKPFSEDGLVAKILENQTQKFGKIKDKRLSQDISFVTVKVLEDHVMCSFIRVIKIEGIPLSVPTELNLSLIEGNRTRANPIGIYVSGIVERESAK